MRAKRLGACMLAFMLLAGICASQQLSKKITNQDVIDLVGLGLSDGVIIDKIHSADATDFDTSIAALKKLKAAKVSDELIRVMINPRPAPAENAAAPAPAADAAGLPSEIGVYLMVKGKLTEVEPEVVGWQTGGMLKSIATGGLTKG